MSKKNKRKRGQLTGKVPASVAAAMRAANRGGQYGAAIATKAMIEELGAMTRGMYAPTRSPRRKLTKEEKKARARVLAAHRASAAGAARLGRRKKRSKVAPRKKAAARKAAPPQSQRRTSKKKVRTVTADAVIRAAEQKALRRWLCEGPRRSGCGAGGSRVITGKGSFKRIRPHRLMTAGG